MTTTGFGTADSTAWGPLAAMTLLLLMFVGASAGSTGGSIKVIRHLLLFKLVSASSSRPCTARRWCRSGPAAWWSTSAPCAPRWCSCCSTC